MSQADPHSDNSPEAIADFKHRSNKSLWKYGLVMAVVTVVAAYAADPQGVTDKIRKIIPFDVSQVLPETFGRSSCGSENTLNTVRSIFNEHYGLVADAYTVYGITSKSVDNDSKTVTCSSLLKFKARPDSQYKLDYSVQKTIDRDDIYVELSPAPDLEQVLALRSFFSWMKDIQSEKAAKEAQTEAEDRARLNLAEAKAEFDEGNPVNTPPENATAGPNMEATNRQ